MKITIVGTGYVGLVTGACLADIGNDVVCLDVDANKIGALNQGGIPIYEPGLKELVQKNALAGRLRFTTDVVQAVRHGTMQFIAVGTPPDEDGSADLGHVLAAARNIGRYMQSHTIIVNKSTVPVGTADKVRAAVQDELRARQLDVPFAVVSNPEFLKEGAAIQDFCRPDRIVVGTDDESAAQMMRDLYAPYVRNHDRFLLMDIRSAELTKYAANAMLATRISFMNELANLSEALGADIESVRVGIGSDSRIGYSFLYAGCGYGGSCFPKDVRALLRTAENSGQRLHVLSAVEEANERQKRVLGEKVRRTFGDRLEGKRFAVWGLSFKPNTDDMREAPSQHLIGELLGAGGAIQAYDPVASTEARKLMPPSERLHYAGSALAACEGADALIILTEWKEFRSPDFDALRTTLRHPIIFDGRNLFDPALPARYGFEYHPIGRRTSRP